jgi:DUF971 family protein
LGHRVQLQFGWLLRLSLCRRAVPPAHPNLEHCFEREGFGEKEPTKRGHDEIATYCFEGGVWGGNGPNWAVGSRVYQTAARVCYDCSDRMDPKFKAKRIHSPRGARETTIGWADGREFKVSHKTLRGYCPCAGCQGHEGPVRFLERSDTQLELEEITPVGNYALLFKWFDGHDSGIYSFAYLRGLCHQEEFQAAGLPLPDVSRATGHQPS